MAEVAKGPWQGGKYPGGVSPYNYKGAQVGWRFFIQGAEARNLPKGVRNKRFYFSKLGEGAKIAAEAYQRQIAVDHGLEIKNQYRYCEDPRDNAPYIEFHIRGTAGEDHYPMCDVGDLRLLTEHTWCVAKSGNNIYVLTVVRIDGRRTTKYFHRFKCPDWPIVDHFSQIKKENRNGLDNRSKHLRDGSGGVNEENCRLQKNNKSGVNGVHYDTRNKAWRVRDQAKRGRFRPKIFPGPKDKTHSSYHEACAYAREQYAKIGVTNGTMPGEDTDDDPSEPKEDPEDSEDPDSEEDGSGDGGP